MDKIGGRKLVIAMVCLILGAAIDLTTVRGLSQNLLYLMLGIIGTFSVANVASKIATKKLVSSVTSDKGLVKRVDQGEVALIAMADQMSKTQSLVQAANKRVAILTDALGKSSE